MIFVHHGDFSRVVVVVDDGVVDDDGEVDAMAKVVFVSEAVAADEDASVAVLSISTLFVRLSMISDDSELEGTANAKSNSTNPPSLPYRSPCDITRRWRGSMGITSSFSNVTGCKFSWCDDEGWWG